MSLRDEYINKIENIPTASFNKEQKEIAKKIIKSIDEKDLGSVYNLITQRVKTGFVFDEAPEINHDAVALVKEDESLRINGGLEKVEHKLIIGENYDALKNLCATYIDKNGKGIIDVIYIDPPYNTEASKADGNDYKEELEASKFIYRDKFTRDGWLNMMNERLKLAKRLLSDSGVIFISIDDKEQAYLKVLCDEIFGENNFIGCVARVSKKGGNKGTLLKPKKDYILVYGKDTDKIDKEKYGKFNIIEEPIWEEEIFNGEKRLFINNGIPYRAKLETRPNQRYFIECPDGSLIIPPGNVFPPKKADGEMIKPQSEDDKCWTWSRERYLKEKQIGRFIFKKTDKSVYLNEQGNPSFWSIYKKKFKTEFLDDEENNDETLLKKEILSDYLDKFPTSEGTKDLNVLGLDFEYPKPVSLIKYLVEIVENGKKTIVLDFFAGSGTTGQAVMELNEEDGGNRQFILVTNNENGIGEKITRERLYRVINGQGSKGEKIAWKYSEDKPYLSNNSVRVFKIENTELKLNDLEKAEKLKEQAKLEFKKLNPNAEFSNDFDIYNELSALNPIKK